MRKKFDIEISSNPGKILIINEAKKEDSHLFIGIINHFSQNQETFVYSLQKLPKYNAHTVSNLTIHFLDKLSQKLDSAVILFSDIKKKKETLLALEKLKNTSKKTLILIPYSIISECQDLLQFSEVHEHFYVGVVGTLFGQNFPESKFWKIIQNSFASKTFVVEGNELTELYSISENDLFKGIDYLLFSKIVKKRYFELFYSKPKTVVSLVHALKRLEPELSVIYGDTSHKLPGSADKKTLHSLENGSSIEYVFDGFEKSVLELLEKPAKTHHQKKHSKLKQLSETAFKYGGIIFLIFCFYLGVSLCILFISTLSFKDSFNSLKNGNISTAQKQVATAKSLFDISSPPINLIVFTSNVFYKNNLGIYLATYDSALDASESVTIVLKQVQEKKAISKEEINTLISNGVFLYFLMQDLKLDQEFSFLKNKTLEKLLPTIYLLEEIAGYKKEMRYLILFQNNAELRPTGGFIGSVGLLTVKNGKIDSFEIQDVYDIDGQLTEHTEPHFVIRRYLQPHLYLRDSNFNPDFEVTASMSALLYDKAVSEKVDGVISVDTEVLKKLLEITGSISIPGQDTITSENVVALLHDSIHDDFFPGSTEKKRLLGSVFNTLVASFESDFQKQMQFMSGLPELFYQKHILFSFQDEALQRGIIGSGIGGSFVETRLKNDELRDTLSINEANIGVNKINTYITRDVSYFAYLKEQSLTSDTAISYENRGNEDYTMYLRIVVPKQSEVKKITIDGVDQKTVPAVTDPVFFERPNFKPPEGLEVSEEEINESLKAVGARIVVPKKSNKRIRFTTERVVENLSSSFTYSLWYVKQPGTNPYPLEITFQTDSFYKRTKEEDNSPVIFKGNVLGDEIFSVHLQKVNTSN